MSLQVDTLWSVPVVAGLSAVWVDTPGRTDLQGLSQDGQAIEIVSRHHIFSIGRQTQVLIVATGVLRDGATVAVKLGHNDQEATDVDLCVRLASWREPRTNRVINLIASSILGRSGSADQSPLIRFLSLAAAWRQQCNAVASIGEHDIVAVDVASDLLKQEVSVYCVKSGRLSVMGAQVCPVDSHTSLLVLPADCGSSVYLPMGEHLIELEIKSGRPDRNAAAATLRKYPQPVLTQLLDALLEVGASQEDVAETIGGAFRSLPVQIGKPDSQNLKLLWCVEAERQLYLFLECPESVQLTSLSVQLGAGVNLDLDWNRFQQFGNDGSQTVRQIVATASLPSAARLCRIVATIDDQQHSKWVLVSNPGDAGGKRVLDEFWSVSVLDDEFLSAVATPLLTAHASRVSRIASSVRVQLTPGASPAANDVEVQLISHGNLEELTRSCIAFGLTAGMQGVTLRIILAAPEKQDAVSRAVAALVTRYGIDATVEPVHSTLPVLWWNKNRDAPRSRLIVALREGDLPSHGAWLDQIRTAMSGGNVVLAGLADRANGLAWPDTVADQVIGIAAPAELLADPDLFDARCQSFEGACTAWVQRLMSSGRADVCDGFPFFSTGTRQQESFAGAFDAFLGRTEGHAPALKLAQARQRPKRAGLPVRGTQKVRSRLARTGTL